MSILVLRDVAFVGIVTATLTFGQASAALSDENDIDVRASKEGEMIVVDVDLAVRASQDEVWSVLTDYDHMGQFVANLESSAVISRIGNALDGSTLPFTRYQPPGPSSKVSRYSDVIVRCSTAPLLI